MFKKNRILSGVLMVALCTGLLAGCGKNATNTNNAESDSETTASLAQGDKNMVAAAEDASNQKYSVVCTIFPEYDWAREVIGELADEYEMTLLLDNGVDLHNYQPTADDIAKIADCDLFIYVGGESDGWVRDALKESTNEDMQVINLLEVLGDSVKEEELVEGMQESEHEHEHDEAHDEAHDEEHDEAHDEAHDEEHDEAHDEAHDETHDEEHDEAHDEAHDEEHEHGEEIEYDEHVWLSLKNAQTLVSAITDSLKVIDSANADIYQANCDQYNAKLAALDKDYENAVAKASQNTILFGDRFPFRYLADDYALDYYAAFVGCSAETEASFETVIFLAEKVDELGLKHVLVIENSDQKIAETVVQSTKSKDQEILVLNSLQSVTTEDMENGVTYFSVMQDNLEVLTKALD